MLAPDTRVLLTDALRPPDGYYLDVAVGTTYTLDLTALLLAPLSFAFVAAGDNLATTDPAALLAAVRQYSERTTVFCQAGAIAVPPAYQRVLAFAEGCVHEVAAPQAGRLFHPKVWGLRFTGDAGVVHRLVVLSRNLTFDRSWDTSLVLDESDEGHGVEAAGAGDFFAALPRLCLQPMPDARREQVESLAESFRGARLVAPAPFETGELLPLGLGAAGSQPVPAGADRLLVVSPFLDAGSVRLAGRVRERTLVSRPDELTRIGGAALAGWETLVMASHAEAADSAVDLDASGDGSPAGDDRPSSGAEASTPSPGTWAVHGLHAKVVVADVGSRAQLVTGSANFTGAGWGGNVEFSVRLEGTVARCGVRAVLDAGKEGLSALLEPFVVEDQAAQDDPRMDTERAIDEFHLALAVAGPRVVVGSVEGDITSLDVSLGLPETLPGATRVWPITLPADAHAQPLESLLTWPVVSVAAITPFLAVETTAGSGRARVTRRCVLKAELVGDPPQRHQDVLRAMLHDIEAVARYLALLLAEPELGASLLLRPLSAHDGSGADQGAAFARPDVVLFEPLVRASIRDAAAVGRIASIVEELREVEGLMPPEFDALWAVVQEFVHEEIGP